MRHRRQGWIACVAGVCAVGLTGILMAQAQESDTRTKESSGGREAGREGRSGGADSPLLIAHGLAMAIEGSTLQSLAMQARGDLGAGGAAGAGGGTSGLSGGGRTGDVGRGPGGAARRGGQV